MAGESPMTLGAMRAGAGVLVLMCVVGGLAMRGRVRDASPAWSGATGATRVIDVNRASAAELELLPGIGPGLAARIIEDRAQRGAFASVADLERVRGIGPRTVLRLDGFAVAR